MTWTRVADDYPDRPNVFRMHRSARYLQVEAWVWCNRFLTDGELPDFIVPRITDTDDLERDVAQLVEHGHWTRLASDDGWWTGPTRRPPKRS